MSAESAAVTAMMEHRKPTASYLENSAEHSAADAGEGHAITALVLNCMDYRLVDDVTRYMDSRGLRNQYDQMTLAGAAIGVMTEKRSAWGETFWEHVSLARDLHGINKIIVIDHRDCGACKAFVDADCSADRDTEYDIHQQWLTRLATEIHVREPTLDVELLLMDLDGNVEAVS